MVRPRGKIERSNQVKPGYLKIGEPQVEIAAWSRDDKAQLPPEQVHFIVHWPAGWEDIPPLVIRFKSPDTIGFFIEELTRFRRHVWPEAEQVKVESNV